MTAEPFAIVLPAPNGQELAKLAGGKKGGIYRVGVGREIPDSVRHIALKSLSWQNDAGTYRATVKIQSTSAKSVRVAIRLSEDVAGLTLKYRDTPESLDASSLTGSDPHWSPVVMGDTVLIDLYAKSVVTTNAQIELLALSHIP